MQNLRTGDMPATTLDSREVAKMLDKNHKHLLRDIEGYLSHAEELGGPKNGLSEFFVESTYLSEQNKRLPCYLISKRGCEFLGNKLTGAKGTQFTAAYVNRFNEMEQAQMFADVDEIKRILYTPDMLISLATQIKERDEKIAALEPKAKIYDMAMESDTKLSFNVAAKILCYKDMGQNNLFAFLRRKGILMENNVPYQQYVKCGYFHVKEYPYRTARGEIVMSYTTQIYQKGLEFINNLLVEDGHTRIESKPRLRLVPGRPQTKLSKACMDALN